MSLDELEKIADIAQATTAVIAVWFGGLWTYMLFVRRRQKFPRAKIEHLVSCRQIVERNLLLSIDVTITNSGEVLLSLVSWEISVKHMLPPRSELLRFIAPKELNQFEQGVQIIEWETLASRKDKWKKGKFEIEPGEQHQIHSDFLLNSDAKTVLIESYFRNVEKRSKRIGWSLITIHDLQPLHVSGDKICYQNHIKVNKLALDKGQGQRPV